MAYQQFGNSMSEEDLQRLAAILRSRNEGLAAINQGEADLLKALGGSAEPMPGTQGFGVGGGPIRSYYDESTGGDSGGEGGEQSSAQGSDEPDQGAFETRPEVIANRKSSPDDNDNDTPPPPPPPQYGPDLNGNMHSSQAALDAANKAFKIDKATDLIQSDEVNQQLRGDTNFTLWFDQNKEKVIHTDDAGNEIKLQDLDAADVQSAFDDVMKLVTAESGQQTANLKYQIVQLFNDGTFSARGKRVRDAQGNIIDKIPTSFEDANAVLSEKFPDSFGRLSDAQKRAVLEGALGDFSRQEAFTLTQEDIQKFSRPAITMGTVDDITETDIGEVTDATAATAGTVDDVVSTTIATVTDVGSDAGELRKVIAREDELIQMLMNRVSGQAPSPAMLQMKRGMEDNLKSLVATATGEMDPAKVRQVRNMYAGVQQQFAGQAAQLRSQEQIAAEQTLLEALKMKGTREAQIKLANMEKDVQTAIAQGNLDQARKIKDQQAALTLVVTQAEMENDAVLANLEKERLLAVEQGKLDLATKIGNLEKNMLISKMNATLAMDGRRQDDAMAIAAFEGEMALEGLETKINLAQMEQDLAIMGFQLQRDLAELDAETQKELAYITAAYKREIAKGERDDAKLGALFKLAGSALGTWAALKTSDINAKREIRAADSQVEGFLDALNAYQYKYKDPQAPGADPGMFVGVMAQDLEKSPMGASFVKDTPHGKMVDYGHGLAAILASQSNLHDRLRQLEEG
jgi:hypothetical protein